MVDNKKRRTVQANLGGRRPAEKPEAARRKPNRDPVQQCDDILSLLDSIEKPEGQDWADDVRPMIEDMRGRLNRYGSATSGQQRALDNVEAAAERWQPRD